MRGHEQPSPLSRWKGYGEGLGRWAGSNGSKRPSQISASTHHPCWASKKSLDGLLCQKASCVFPGPRVLKVSIVAQEPNQNGNWNRENGSSRNRKQNQNRRNRFSVAGTGTLPLCCDLQTQSLWEPELENLERAFPWPTADLPYNIGPYLPKGSNLQFQGGASWSGGPKATKMGIHIYLLSSPAPLSLIIDRQTSSTCTINCFGKNFLGVKKTGNNFLGVKKSELIAGVYRWFWN